MHIPALLFLLTFALLLPAAGAADDQSARGAVLFSCDNTVGRILDAILMIGACSLPAAPEPQQLQLMMAGLPRAGSSSLKLALERLGFSALHGSEIFAWPELNAALHSRDCPQVLALTESFGYNASLEYHVVCWEEMLAMRPQARVILLSREFESWYGSLARLLAAIQIKRYPLKYLLRHVQEGATAFWGHYSGADGTCAIGLTCPLGGEQNRALWRAAYERLHRRVREVVPPTQLLVMDLGKGDGYPQLCAFLGMASEDCPDDAFPRANSSGEVEAMGRFFRTLEIASIILPLLFCLGVWWCCCKRVCAGGGLRKGEGRPRGTKEKAKNE